MTPLKCNCQHNGPKTTPLKCDCGKDTIPLKIGYVCESCLTIYNEGGEVWFTAGSSEIVERLVANFKIN